MRYSLVIIIAMALCGDAFAASPSAFDKFNQLDGFALRRAQHSGGAGVPASPPASNSDRYLYLRTAAPEAAAAAPSSAPGRPAKKYAPRRKSPRYSAPNWTMGYERDDSIARRTWQSDRYTGEAETNLFPYANRRGNDGVDAEASAQVDVPPPEVEPTQPLPEVSVPIAERNTYFIFVKPGTSSEQLDKLLTEYQLQITEDFSKIGGFEVRRTAGAAAADTHVSTSLEDLLEPKIIKDLRNEPIVHRAFVAPLMTPSTLRGLPQSKNMAVSLGTLVLKWNWQEGVGNDGNWGFKQVHLPSVWHLMALDPEPRKKAKIAIVDHGFIKKHEDLSYVPFESTLLASLPSRDCRDGHGTHVAGIVSASFDNQLGTDGVVPQADVRVIELTTPFSVAQETDIKSANFLFKWLAPVSRYVDVFRPIYRYTTEVVDNEPNLKHVLNVSLTYNLYDGGAFDGACSAGQSCRPEDNAAFRVWVESVGASYVELAAGLKDRLVIVAAAGNDSEKIDPPLQAKWASPVAWAGIAGKAGNIIVVEAINRQGKRAPFSNVGGDVAAPGVDIMSTSGPDASSYTICSGTSQAAPHVTGLAALLFETAPNLTAEQVVQIIKHSATKSDPTGAPSVDALAAVNEAMPGLLLRVADVNHDGIVDGKDLHAHNLDLIQTATKASPPPASATAPGPAAIGEAKQASTDTASAMAATVTPSVAPLADPTPVGGDQFPDVCMDVMSGFRMRADLAIMRLLWAASAPISFDEAWKKEASALRVHFCATP